MELDKVLSDEPLEEIAEEEVTTEVETATEEVETVAEVETEEVVEAKVEVEAETTPAVEEPEDGNAKAYYTAMKDERRKAQEYKRQVEELEAAANQQPKPECWEDPEKAISQVKHEMTTDFENRLLNMSEASARSRYEDFQDKADVFLELSNNSPQLFHEMKNAADPAEFAYKHAQKFLAFKEMGDPRGTDLLVDRPDMGDPTTCHSWGFVPLDQQEFHPVVEGDFGDRHIGFLSKEG